MVVTEVTDWVTDNYGLIVIVGVFILILFHKQIISFISKIISFKKKEEEVEVPFLQTNQTPNMQESLLQLEESALFADIQKKDSLAVFHEERKVALKFIKSIKEEGKQLINQERGAALEYNQKVNIFNNNRKQLGIKYTTWFNKLQTIENMIVQQAHMDEELKKLKGDVKKT